MLDPSDTSAALASYPKIKAAIPKHVRSFGFIPKPDDLLISDAILSGPTKFTLKHRTIRSVQSKILNGPKGDAHVQWTHVATSTGSFELVEAVWPKIALNSMLENYVPGYRMKARRIPDWTDKQRNGFSEELKSRVGTRYDWWTAIKCAAAVVPGINRLVRPPRPSGGICSGAYADTYTNRTFGESLWPGEKLARAALPADISRSPVLKDVDWNWLKLP